MKFAKLSIAALAVVGFSSSAVAMDMSGVTAKPYVKTKLYYETIDKDVPNAPGLFEKDASTGQALVTAGITGSLDQCWGYGFEYNIADTLGLENNIVSGVRMGNDENRGALQTQDWASQAYVTYSACNTVLSNTTFKIGRQFLDTPFAFTEKWNLAQNSFDAIVLLNQDIKNVTLVGAYVGRGNGVFAKVANGDDFQPYMGFENETYAVGAMTNLLEGLPINAWYYSLASIADAAWVDGAYTLKLADDMNVGLGAQYGMMMPTASGAGDTAGYAVKASGKVGMFNLMAAYSSVDDDDGKASLPLANTATGFKKTKLYTAGIYTDGTGVAVPGSDAFKVKASVKVPGVGKLIAQYVSCENDNGKAMQNVDEIDVILATKIAGIGAKLIYMDRDVTHTSATAANAKFGMDTQHVRVILSKDF